MTFLETPSEIVLTLFIDTKSRDSSVGDECIASQVSCNSYRDPSIAWSVFKFFLRLEK